MDRVRTDDTNENRLAYADVIAEFDEPRAEMIRLQCGVYRTKTGRPRQTKREQKLLLKQYGERWLLWLSALEVETEYVTFERGFVEEVIFREPTLFANYADLAFAAAPLLKHVSLNGHGSFGINFDHMLECAALKQLESFKCIYSNVGSALQSFTSAERWGNLKLLAIYFDHFGATGLKSLAENADRFPRLNTLIVGQNEIETGLAELAASAFSRRLEYLELSYNPIGDAGLQQLLGSPWPRLKQLELVDCGLTGESVHDLCTSEALPAIELLQLSGNEFGEPELQQLHSQFGSTLQAD